MARTRARGGGRKRLRIGVLFGGRSAEHEVSLVSATSVIAALNPARYVVVPIGITPSGAWLASPGALGALKRGRGAPRQSARILLPEPGRRGLEAVRGGRARSLPLDVLFPVLHGTFGEDGTMQGLFELAGIPYVGAGVLGSAAGMDKIVTKQLCEQAGVPVAPYIWFAAGDFRRERARILASVRSRLGFPCFVKPANLGSSVGISKARTPGELAAAIRLALRYDRRILVEKSIERAREIEVSVLGNDSPEASLPGEVLSSNEFYDYDAKYVDGKSTAVVPARLAARTVKALRDYAVQTFRAVDCAGMARVDFLVERRSGAIVMNEINTIPGFTPISMFPKLWEATGVPYPELLDRLIGLAIERHGERSALLTAYRPKSRWYARTGR